MIDGPLFKRGPIPVYYQVMQIIRSQIVSGHYPPNSRLPTEDDYVKGFKVSRQTIRLALQHLVNEGMIERHAGRGSFVCARPNSQTWLARDIDDFINETVESRREILSKETVSAEEWPEAAAVFGKQIQKLFLLRIRRHLAESVQSLSFGFLPLELAQRIPEHLFDRRVVGQLIEQYCHVRSHRMEVSFSAELADFEAVELLGLRPGEPVVVFERVVYARDGSVIQFTRSLYRPDRRRQRLELLRRTGANEGRIVEAFDSDDMTMLDAEMDGPAAGPSDRR